MIYNKIFQRKYPVFKAKAKIGSNGGQVGASVNHIVSISQWDNMEAVGCCLTPGYR